MSDSYTERVAPGPQRPHRPRLPKDLRTAWLLLLLRSEPSYGYVLRRELSARGLDVEAGTLYRTLRELEGEGLISSDWRDPAGGPRSRVYTVTSEGERVLAGLALSIEQLRSAQAMFLSAYDRGT